MGVKRKLKNNTITSNMSVKKRSFEEKDAENSEEEMEKYHSSDQEEDYEKKPRHVELTKVRNLLPTKRKDKLTFRSEIVHESEEEEATDEGPEKQTHELTLIENFALQQKLLNDLKCKVALICTSIIAEPEKHMSALKELIFMLQTPTTKIEVQEKKILSLSILHVFMDVLPGYRIRTQEDDSKVRLKKETRKLLGYEKSLLKSYKMYIDYLFQLMKGLKTKSKAISVTRKKVNYEIGLIALKCMCELLSTRFTFNFFKDIANKLVPYAFDKRRVVREMCCNSFERLFEADTLGEASYSLCKGIVDVVKQRKFAVPVDVIKTFFSLNLREAKPEVEKIDMNKGRKEWCNMSRSQRREKKKYKQIEAELKETEAYESVEAVKKYHTLTLNKIFWVFFHILKDVKNKALIGPALEGLSNFAWLINLDFFDDLNTVLCSMMDLGNLNEVEKLHGVYTLFTILAGQAESLHIDPHQIYCHMYQSLLTLGNQTKLNHFELVFKCLEFNIIRKQKKISSSRILAFAKRTCTICLQTPLHGTIGLMTCLKSMISSIKSVDVLLDTESSVGSGLYLPESTDPEHSNAQSTALWELHILKKHYNPVIGHYAHHLLNKCPISGRLSLPDQLARLSAEETSALFSEISQNNSMDFLDAKEPPPKKFKRLITDKRLCYEDSIDLSINMEQSNVNFFPRK